MQAIPSYDAQHARDQHFLYHAIFNANTDVFIPLASQKHKLSEAISEHFFSRKRCFQDSFVVNKNESPFRDSCELCSGIARQAQVFYQGQLDRNMVLVGEGPGKSQKRLLQRLLRRFCQPRSVQALHHQCHVLHRTGIRGQHSGFLRHSTLRFRGLCHCEPSQMFKWRRGRLYIRSAMQSPGVILLSGSRNFLTSTLLLTKAKTQAQHMLHFLI